MPKTYSLFETIPIRRYGETRNTLDREMVCFTEDFKEISAVIPVPLYEGTVKEITLDVYERNPAARKQCLARHGAVCQICGFNFASIYGRQFEGLIHVHHLTPLSNQRTKHTVKPEEDLIPVCPNCHMALHSKKDGVYTPEELKAFITNRRNH